VLWDKKNQTIVNNESSEIIRIFNTEFNDLIPADKAKVDIYPKELRNEIDSINDWVYNTINSWLFRSSFASEALTIVCPDGVYKAGFATTAEAYEAAVYPLFEALDKVEKMLEGKEFFVGNQLTEADVRLWVTIVRFGLPLPLCDTRFWGCLTFCYLSRSALIRSTSDTSNVTSVISAMDIRTSIGWPVSRLSPCQL